MAVSKKLRFEVFRRDNFACKYCGRSALVGGVLEIDHVIARANGGLDVPRNLVTACEDCNAGKSDTPLDAPTVEHVPTVLPDDESDDADQFLTRPNLAPWVEDLDVAASVRWRPGCAHGFGPFGVHVALAIAAGYPADEILAASEAAGAAEDHELCTYLPARDELDGDRSAAAYDGTAEERLKLFVPNEQRWLIWHARRLAGDATLSIRDLVRSAADLSARYVEIDGRDWELLDHYLSILPNGQGSKWRVQATAEWDSVWNGRRAHSAHECPREVLELAVSHALGAEVPH